MEELLTCARWRASASRGLLVGETAQSESECERESEGETNCESDWNINFEVNLRGLTWGNDAHFGHITDTKPFAGHKIFH